MHGSLMTRSQLIQGIAVVALAVIAGVISEGFVDRRFASRQNLQDEVPGPAGKPPSEAFPDAPAPCVNADGSWRNWTSPNVPMLSPKCEDGK
jgi:hypothetical protein